VGGGRPRFGLGGLTKVTNNATSPLRSGANAGSGGHSWTTSPGSSTTAPVASPAQHLHHLHPAADVGQEREGTAEPAPRGHLRLLGHPPDEDVGGRRDRRLPERRRPPVHRRPGDARPVVPLGEALPPDANGGEPHHRHDDDPPVQVNRPKTPTFLLLMSLPDQPSPASRGARPSGGLGLLPLTPPLEED
jgi:hypothetical protein